MSFNVLITDYNYPNLKEEKEVFFGLPINIIDGNGRCLKEEDVINYSRDVDAIISQFVPITKKIIDSLQRCKIIVKYAVGLDTVDVTKATEKKIMVANVPDYCISEVSDHALALILTLLRKVKIMDLEVRKGNFHYEKAIPIRRLTNITLGLVAFGNISRSLARKAQALGTKDIKVFDPFFDRKDLYPDISFVSFEELLTTSDVVSIHAPATESTFHMFRKETLSLMKKGSFLINTSRGALVNEQDLVEVLQEGKLAGAALDVMQKEEIGLDHMLLKFENVVITPHIGWYSEDSIIELKRKAAEQVKEALFDGQPTYWVNRF